MFDMTQHIDFLTPDGGSQTKNELSFHCPVCGAPNFKVNLKSGAYQTFGCDCATTDEGKRKIREAVSPTNWKKPVRPRGRAEYYYDRLKDSTPETIARVIRRDDGNGKRKFHQEHWNSERRKWVAGLPDEIKTQIRLYKIFSEINQNAIKDRGILLLVEGEGKVNALHALGIPASCSIGGAGKWQQYGNDTYAEDLKGARVVLCPDRDLKGVSHMNDVEADLIDNQIAIAGWCYPIPNSPLWQKIPPSGGADVVDWIADLERAGKSAEEIRNRILGAIEPKRTPPPDPPESQTPTPAPDRDNADLFASISQTRRGRMLDLIKGIYGQELSYNAMTKQVYLQGEPLEPDFVYLLLLEQGVDVGKDFAIDCFNYLARKNSFHPVQDYLNRVYKEYGHQHDYLLANPASRYLRTDNLLYDTFLRKTLIAAVARAMNPGCKVDTALIFSGKQGSFKSTFWSILAGEFFCDSLAGQTGETDEKIKLYSAWIHEWAELEQVFKRKENSQVKAFLSAQTDTFRQPWGRSAEKHKRHSIIVGTTNEDDFLADSTGSRRFWVIPIKAPINIELLERERDQLWAAAVAAYKQGASWILNQEEAAQSEALNKQYQREDPWQPEIEQFLESRDSVTVTDVLTNAIGMELARQDRAAQMRIADCLKLLGWRKKHTIHGKIWVRGSQVVMPPSEPSQDNASNYDYPSSLGSHEVVSSHKHNGMATFIPYDYLGNEVVMAETLDIQGVGAEHDYVTTNVPQKNLQIGDIVIPLAIARWFRKGSDRLPPEVFRQLSPSQRSAGSIRLAGFPENFFHQLQQPSKVIGLPPNGLLVKVENPNGFKSLFDIEGVRLFATTETNERVSHASSS